MKNDVYFYENDYYTIEDIYERYNKVVDARKKKFRDSIAHFTLVQIFKKCNYDEKITNIMEELAQIETAIIDMYGTDCGTVILALKGIYQRNLRKLINLSGKIINNNNDIRMKIFDNGEWLLKHLISLTLDSYEIDSYMDLYLINYNSLSIEECQAIADNYVRYMRDEELVFYDRSKHL